MTPIFVCGGECRVLAPASLSTHWDLTGTAPTADTAIVNPGGGGASYHWAAQASVQTFLVHVIAQTTVSARFYVSFAAFPSAKCVFSKFVNANGDAILKIDNTGLVYVRMGASAADVSTTKTLSLNTWYRIDYKADQVAGTATITATIDGANSTTDSHAQVSANFTGLRIGSNVDGNAVTSPSLNFDDLMIAAVADYPVGPGYVQGFLVQDVSGTHSQTAGDFKNEGGTNITNGDSSGAKLNEVTPDNSNYVQHPAIGTAGGYVEYIYKTGTGMAPRAVEQVVYVRNVSLTTANDEKSQLYDGSTASDAYALTTVGTAAGKWWSKCWTSPPSGGAWTPALFSTLRIRWGFSTDIAPVPCIAWTILEAEFAPSLLVPYVNPMPPLLAQ